jgi:hypothetical protein
MKADTVYKVLAFILCVAAYWGFNDWEAIGGEQEERPLLIQQYVKPDPDAWLGAIPQQIHLQREYTPERSLTYHFFECGNYEMPAWSILMRKDGLFILGTPEQIERMENFIETVFRQRPVQLFEYQPCMDHGS